LVLHHLADVAFIEPSAAVGAPHEMFGFVLRLTADALVQRFRRFTAAATVL
jgi:hypothetical protein